MVDTKPALPALDDHVLSIDIKASVRKVWDEIVKTGRIQKALYNTVLESTLQPGARLRYYSPNRKRVFVVGEVLEVTPPHRFKHTYMMTMTPEAPTVVTWELEEIAEGCRVTLIHSGWTDQIKSHKGVHRGWTAILALLKAQLETGTIPRMTRIVYAIQGKLLFLMPKTTRVDEVDKSGW